MTENPAPYPLLLDAAPRPSGSRGLWLVKWLLLVPHLVVLLFLAIAFLLVTVVAFFAILFTARYPRGMFDFNVGVLRWGWRVTYYGYGVLGTDRYPPFTLADVPDYPAHLTVAYPERLSRGLIFVKWLLAVPHLLVLSVFVGGALWVGDTSGAQDAWEGGTNSVGLIALLVLISAVALLFTGRYPRSVYDFVLGMNRWEQRVAAYTLLMTDTYPPLRLDQGGVDPGRQPARPDPRAPSAAPVAFPPGAPPAPTG
ncbi:DUF4389 domain-containing protein [Krasilnikoviella flava]|uniref:DUF4389 domain-containing protein n=1 Tax=Krasilnikoviella flava TaxID=526729 RepID=A0A1T5KVA6_9MICO|nr:DUF4389 domain-containing protein [Krasilnikoviella flava]SKC67329.1 protein of unknown function [Krasilnikoviella flava]